MTSSISSSSSRALRTLCVGLLAVSVACAHRRPAAHAATERIGRVAIFPIEMLAQHAALRDSLSAELEAAIARAGLEVVSEQAVEPHLARSRIRGVGLDEAAAELAREELGADAVLLASVERYLVSGEPVLAITLRLVTVDPTPRVLWMDGFALAAEASHGILGLGGFHDMGELERRASARLGASLAAHLHAGDQRGTCAAGGPFKPRRVFRAPGPLAGRRVAVVPFLNRTANGNAGDAVALHLVRQLVAKGHFDTVDPGKVREALRKLRVFTRDGVAPTEAQRLAEALDVDLIVSGEVLQYDDAGVPKAEFNTLVLDRKESLVWQSSSRGKGDDAVTFFDFGRIDTVSELVCRMAAGVVAGVAGR
jgi:hypothetical protein